MDAADTAPRLLTGTHVIARAGCTLRYPDHLSPRGRRVLKIAVAALVGVPWIPLAAALYAWIR